MPTGIVFAYYEKGGVGVAGLAPLVTVYQIALADLGSTVIINAQAMTEIGGGLYARRVPNLDFSLYWYPFKAVATGADVDSVELAGLVHDFTMVEMTDYGVGTADPGNAMALTGAERTTLAGVVDGQLSTTHGAGSWEGGGSAPTVEEIRAEIDANSTQLAAIRAQTDLLDSTEIAILQPVLSNGDVDMVRGDVYEAVDGRRLEWPIPHRDIAADSTIVVVLQNVAALIGVRLNINRVGLELTHAQSVALPAGVYPFSIQEIQADGDPITLLRGRWATYLYPEPRPDEY